MRRKSVLVVSVVLSLVLMLTGCGNKAKTNIENLMTEFEYSCNTLDVDAMLNCITPEVSEKIKLAIGVVGMFAEKDTDELLDIISDTLLGDEVPGGSEFFSSIKITVDEINVEEGYAIVNATVTYNVSGEEYNNPAIFECSYYNEKWYISDLVFE